MSYGAYTCTCITLLLFQDKTKTTEMAKFSASQPVSILYVVVNIEDVYNSVTPQTLCMRL